MGKRKQKGKLMMMADRERLRLQTNLVGLENQHVATGDIGNENVRRLHGRNIPIPIPPPGIHPEPPRIRSHHILILQIHLIWGSVLQTPPPSQNL